MSAFSSLDYSPPAPQDVPAEPFGQAGVRQYAGRLLAWVLLTVALAGFAMAHRSGSYGDIADWQGKGQEFTVASANGQLALLFGFDDNIRGGGEWRYRGGYGGARWINRLPWQGGLGEALGFEIRSDSPFRNADRGFSVRLRWSTLGIVAVIQPTVYVIGRLLAWRRRGAKSEPLSA